MAKAKAKKEVWYKPTIVVWGGKNGAKFRVEGELAVKIRDLLWAEAEPLDSTELSKQTKLKRIKLGLQKDPDYLELDAPKPAKKTKETLDAKIS